LDVTQYRSASSHRTIKRARKLRKAMSLPEAMLWRELRLRPFELKFRRQHATGRFVLDFYCSDARLTEGCLPKPLGSREEVERRSDLEVSHLFYRLLEGQTQSLAL